MDEHEVIEFLLEKEEGFVTTADLQRKFKLDWFSANCLICDLEEKGVVKFSGLKYEIKATSENARQVRYG